MKSSVIERRRKKAHEIVTALKKLYPQTPMMLNYTTDWELLVAVILSAQCTDKKVNEVTKRLFTTYRTLDDYRRVSRAQFERDIKQIGLYRSKAQNILASAKIIAETYNGVLPDTMEEMLALPGVGRKTANVVLGAAYGIVEGIAVDTHVHRLARRFGLTNNDTPETIERDLMQILPKSEWYHFTHRIINYGRDYCSARTCPSDHPLAKFDKK